VTLIQYGFYLRGSDDDDTAVPAVAGTSSPDGYSAPADPNAHNYDPSNSGANDAASAAGASSGWASISANEWLSYVMMVVGWFILIRAISDYLRARKHELLVLGSPEAARMGVVSVFAEGEQPGRVV